MKRSEMLKLLEFYIYNTEHIDVPTSDYIKEKPMAREILELIEKAGMAPPCDEGFKQHYLKENDYDSMFHFLSEPNNGYLENCGRWEPE